MRKTRDGGWRSRIGMTMSAAALVVYFGPVGLAAAPAISDPSGAAPAGAMPGTFPTTVTAANVNISPIPGSDFGGGGSDNLKIQFPASGPIAWTESRHNEGDIAMSIGPFDPNDSSYFPPNDYVNNYRPIADGEPFANSTLAWRVSRETGALLASVRHNGVDQGDSVNGAPLGITHGIAYFNNGFGQGWGYRMNDGEFANGGSQSADLQMGLAGFDDGRGEASFNVATAYFPYEQGWLGAWVDGYGGVEGEATISTGSPNVASSSIVYTDSIATVSLPGINALTDGMLFVSPTNGDNATDIAGGVPTANGWSVTVREDNDIDFSGNTFNSSSFQFLYVPYTAGGLIGGHVKGVDGSFVNSAGDNRMQLTRTEAGEYAIKILDSDGQTALGENDGMLVLSVAGGAVASSLPGSPMLADRTFLSYQYDDQSGEFIVQSRSVAAIGSPNSENVFGDDLRLTDTDFYFAFVDFNNPLTPQAAALLGDYNGNGVVDAADYTVWKDSFGSTTELTADGNGNGTVDAADYTIWKDNFGNTAAVASVASVPEPHAMTLVLTLLCGLPLQVRLRSQRIRRNARGN
ncbi:MAG: hypothetical protein R3E01_20145 [Pirellulaceae bacterium]|nr:hypothetical protein [Planctomycetales bacterium]